MHAKSPQSCLTLCDPRDCSPSGLLCLWDSPGKNTGVAYHAFFQRNLPNPGIKPTSPESAALAGIFFIIRATWEALTLP